MNALDYIQNNIIEGKVEKIENQAESVRFYNYPYNGSSRSAPAPIDAMAALAVA